MKTKKLVSHSQKIITKEESTRERIVTEAIRLFCHKGYEATAVHEIVEAANVSKPVLYYYFRNKEDLFRQIIENTLFPFQENMFKICSESKGDFRSALKSIVNLYIQNAQLYPERVRFIHTIAFSALYDNIFDFMGFWQKNLECVITLFQEGLKCKYFRNDISAEVLARNFLALVMGAVQDITYGAELFEHEPSSREIVEIFLIGVKR